MFDWRHYVPILRCKAGELAALETLRGPVKAAITPMLELPNIPWDFVAEQPSKTTDDYVRPMADKITRSWASDERFFVDLSALDSAGRMSDGGHPLTYLTSALEANGLNPIPVIGLDQPSAYQEAVRLAAQKRGVCLRLRTGTMDYTEAAGIEAFIEALGASPETTDLVVDFEDVKPDGVNGLVFTQAGVLGLLPCLERWRTLTVAASAFPLDLRDIKPDSSVKIARAEWQAWCRHASNQSLKRIPAFGDYGIAHPDYVEIDPRLVKMSAALRYTLDDTWLVAKGRNVRDYAFDQVHEICRSIVRLPEFKGAGFSWGDEFIQRCADDQTGPGNATTWRQAGTSHHLTLVTQQVASVPDPS